MTDLPNVKSWEKRSPACDSCSSPLFLERFCDSFDCILAAPRRTAAGLLVFVAVRAAISNISSLHNSKSPDPFWIGAFAQLPIKPTKSNRKSILSSLFKKPPSAGDIQTGRQPKLFHILHRAAEAPVSDAQHRKRRLQTRHLIAAGWRRDAADSLSVRPMFQKTFSVYHSPLNPCSKFPQ